MCLSDTDVRFRTPESFHVSGLAGKLAGILALSAGLAVGQAQVGSAGNDKAPQLAVDQTSMAWKRVAGTTFNAGLAGAASGPVVAVWYAAGTGALLAQTESSRIFETADFVHWRLNSAAGPKRLEYQGATLRNMRQPCASPKTCTIKSTCRCITCTRSSKLGSGNDSPVFR